MFMGEYQHNLDAKGRLIIPAKFRSELGMNMIVTQGLDGCLSIYTKEAWDKIYAQLQLLPTTKKEARAFVRILISKASEVEIDNQGRILIPAGLLKQAHIEKECTIVGAGEKVEIWASDAWANYLNESEESFEDLAESLTGFML